MKLYLLAVLLTVTTFAANITHTLNEEALERLVTVKTVPQDLSELVNQIDTVITNLTIAFQQS